MTANNRPPDSRNMPVAHAPQVAELQRRLDDMTNKYKTACKSGDELIAEVADIKLQLASMTADRDSECRWACQYKDERDLLQTRVTELEAVVAKENKR